MHLSAGDLLRAKRVEGGALGEQIDTYIKEGKVSCLMTLVYEPQGTAVLTHDAVVVLGIQIVPNEVTVKLIQEAMVSSGSKIFLIDGSSH